MGVIDGKLSRVLSRRGCFDLISRAVIEGKGQLGVEVLEALLGLVREIFVAHDGEIWSLLGVG